MCKLFLFSHIVFSCDVCRIVFYLTFLESLSNENFHDEDGFTFSILAISCSSTFVRFRSRFYIFVSFIKDKKTNKENAFHLGFAVHPRIYFPDTCYDVIA